MLYINTHNDTLSLRNELHSRLRGVSEQMDTFAKYQTSTPMLTWRVTLSIPLYQSHHLANGITKLVSSFAIIYAMSQAVMTSSTKPELHSASQRRPRYTETWATRGENFVSIRHVVSEICDRADRHTDRSTWCPSSSSSSSIFLTWPK